eukprot:s614_g20.t1
MSQGPSATVLSELVTKVDRLISKVDQLATQVESLERALDRAQLASAPSVSAPSAAGSRSSQYDVLAQQIPEIPGWALDLGGTLQDCGISRRDRVSRAWESGSWARFVLEERISAPRPSRPINLPNKIYVVLKAPGFACPLFCESAAAYRAVVQEFQGTLSHGFPSKAEAKIYCGAAGLAWPERPYQWSSNR